MSWAVHVMFVCLKGLGKVLELQRSRESLCALRSSPGGSPPLNRPVPPLVFVQNESGDPARVLRPGKRPRVAVGGIWWWFQSSFPAICGCRIRLLPIPLLNGEANAQGIIIHADDPHNSIEVIRRMMEEISTFCGFININKMIPWLKIIIIIFIK